MFVFIVQATSEHTDLVSRRMGFIPLPLGCLLFRTISQSVDWAQVYWLQLGVTAYIRSGVDVCTVYIYVLSCVVSTAMHDV